MNVDKKEYLFIDHFKVIIGFNVDIFKGLLAKINPENCLIFL